MAEKLLALMPVLTYCVMYAGLQIWGLSNLGLAWRHKQMVMPLFFMLLGVSIIRLRDRRRERLKNAARTKGFGRPIGKPQVGPLPARSDSRTGLS